jgi:hypothetical protein
VLPRSPDGRIRCTGAKYAAGAADSHSEQVTAANLASARALMEAEYDLIETRLSTAVGGPFTGFIVRF